MLYAFVNACLTSFFVVKKTEIVSIPIAHDLLALLAARSRSIMYASYTHESRDACRLPKNACAMGIYSSQTPRRAVILCNVNVIFVFVRYVFPLQWLDNQCLSGNTYLSIEWS